MHVSNAALQCLMAAGMENKNAAQCFPVQFSLLSGGFLNQTLVYRHWLYSIGSDAVWLVQKQHLHHSNLLYWRNHLPHTKYWDSRTKEFGGGGVVRNGADRVMETWLYGPKPSLMEQYVNKAATLDGIKDVLCLYELHFLRWQLADHFTGWRVPRWLAQHETSRLSSSPHCSLDTQ